MSDDAYGATVAKRRLSAVSPNSGLPAVIPPTMSATC